MNSKVIFKTIFIFYLVFFSYGLIAQNEGNIWYFGYNAGVDFNGSAPVPLTDGALFTLEGCSTICDSSGNLLFYSDGRFVWNKEHSIMPNGNGLLGDSSSTQSALIVKKPGNNSIYLLFTVGAQGNNGLKYSEADLSLQNGLGDINSNKNIPILDSSCEKIAAVKHQNGTDYWIIAYARSFNFLHSYLLTSSGLNLSPIISDGGTPINIFSELATIGYLQASPAGNRIAMANRYSNFIQIYDFDNSTGLASNPIPIYGFWGPDAYGIVFSPNGNIVYTSTVTTNHCDIHQINLLAGSEQEIIDSKILITVVPNSGGALQLAPDGKIYLAQNNQPFLGVINQPDSIGVACDFNTNGIDLAGKHSKLGLPNFPNSAILESPFSINYTNVCIGDTTFFSFSPSSVDSVQWDFGDINSGNSNSSTEIEPSHVFTQPGFYALTLTIYNQGDSTILTNLVYISSIPNVDLGDDITLCQGDSLILNVSTTNAFYQWQDNSINSTFVATQDGTYWVELSKYNCSASDSINVYFDPSPIVELGVDTTLCIGGSLTLNAANPNAIYAWQDNSVDSNFIVTQNGIYWVKVSNQYNCSSFDTISISYITGPSIALGADSSLCEGELMILDATYPNATYLWQDDSIDSTYVVSQQGLYWASVTNICGSYSDSIEVLYNDLPIVELGIDTSICLGDSLILIVGDNYTQIWSTGDTSEIISVFPIVDSEYSVVVTNTLGCSNLDSILVIVNELPFAEIFGPTELCPDTAVSISANGGVHYLWNTGDNTSEITITPSEPIIYTVTVTDENNCTSIDSLNIDVDESYCFSCGEYGIPNIFSPNGDQENDLFQIYTKGEVVIFDFKIYSRWGNLVHHSLGPWDGTYLAENLPSDVYIYMVTLETNCGKKQLRGDVTLIR